MDARGDLIGFLGLLVILFIVWIAIGGPERALTERNSESGRGGFLSFEIPTVNLVERGSGLSFERSNNTAPGPASGVPDRELTELERIAQREKVNAALSPYAGAVEIGSGRARASITQEEYVTLRTRSGSGEAIPITGWRLESAVTGNFGTIKGGVLIPGADGGVESTLFLTPGDRILVSSYFSPIGVSFQENICTGYFEYNRRFIPTLARSCPSPIDELEHFSSVPVTDDDCYSFTRRLPRCEEVRRDLNARDVEGNFVIEPPLSPVCQRFLKEELNYETCVAHHRHEPDFFSGTWRVYLGSFAQLWRENREVIVLKDSAGRLVDILTY